MRTSLLFAGFVCLGLASAAAQMAPPTGPNIVSGGTAAPLRGVYEISMAADAPIADPYLGADVTVTFTRPDASTVTVDGFHDGVSEGRPVFKARAYCDQAGGWSWTCASPLAGPGGRAGAFAVTASSLPGKLRKHPSDPHQFAYDNGRWFLHIGDTGYRYVVDTEPEWQAYIDQAVQMGATKVRTWFCRSRSGVEALFSGGRTALDVAYWQEIDRRIQYALNHHPQVILQLIPYGEDTQELLRYGRGDAMSKFVARYAQARLSAFPNVMWCISNDQDIVSDGGTGVPAPVINAIGQDMAAREPWGTLLTNHQARHGGYSFTSSTWSDVTTLEDMDQVDGALLLQYREKADDPAVNDEDRYELYRAPAHPAYFFRRLMWGSLLSGGHATYDGARTYEPHGSGANCGVRGYYDLKAAGVLSGGADHFVHIHNFFNEAGITLAGMRPADALAGNNPGATKVIAGAQALIAYLPNADSETPGTANAAATNAVCQLQLPAGEWRLRWFNPQTGAWIDDPTPGASGGGSPRVCTAPFAGDAVLAALRPDFRTTTNQGSALTVADARLVLKADGAGATGSDREPANSHPTCVLPETVGASFCPHAKLGDLRFLMAKEGVLYVDLSYDADQVCREFTEAFPGANALPYGFGVQLSPKQLEWAVQRLDCPLGSTYYCFDTLTGESMPGRITGIASYLEGGNGDMGFVGMLDLAAPMPNREASGRFGETIIGIACPSDACEPVKTVATVHLSQAKRAAVQSALRETLKDATCTVTDTVMNPKDKSVLACADYAAANVPADENTRNLSLFYLVPVKGVYHVVSFALGDIAREQVGFPLDAYPGALTKTRCSFLPDMNGDQRDELFISAAEGFLFSPAVSPTASKSQTTKTMAMVLIRNFHYGMRE